MTAMARRVTYEQVSAAETISGALEAFALSVDMALDDLRGAGTALDDLADACRELIREANRRKAEADETLARAEREELRELNRQYRRGAL